MTVENRDPLVSVADATVREGVGAELLFDVSLDRALAEVVTVDYATSDGTATAGSDYTATSGRLTFATGETENTVRVPVLNDAHDEGIETLTLTLSNARGAALGNAEATGRIVNSGPIPAAWTARFGRTVADQVLEAVAGRMTAPQTVATEISLAGHQVDFSNGHSSHGVNDNLFGSLEERQEREAEKKSRAITGREMLTGSSFLLSDRSAEGSFGALWGRGVVTSFDGREGDLDLDGEVVSGLVGADWTEGRTTMGLVMAHSRGEGAYQGPSGHGENGKSGKIEATLTGIYPWARHALNDRLSVWGVAGYGAGTLTLTSAGQAPMETETDLAMAAVGGHRVVREAPAFGGLELAILSDALVVRTTTGRVNGDSGAGGGSGNLAASAAEVTRLRLGLEATWRGSGGGSLEPSFVPVFGIEVRHDGGDAETGFGSALGAGFIWTDPVRGIRADFRARGLLNHEDGSFRERVVVAGSLSWDPDPGTDRGWSLDLARTLGSSATGGLATRLNPGATRVFGVNGLNGFSGTADANDENGAEDLERRLEANLGYGFALFDGRYTGTPALGLGLSEDSREASLGWHLAESRSSGLVFGLDVEGRRSESGDGETEHRFGVGFGWQLKGGRPGDAEFGIRFKVERLEAANDDGEPEHRFGVRMKARW